MSVTIRELIVKFGFKVDKKSERETEESVKGIKDMASKLLGGIAVVFSIAKMSEFSKSCVQAASVVQEMENKFDVVFTGIRDEVDAWAGDFADAVGRNKNAIKTYLADQQNLLVGFGMAREEGAKLAEEMTSLALDIASFANQDEDVAVNAMTKAVMGESEAAKTLGAVLNDTTRAETMLEMGLTGSYNALDQLTKMQVNYNTILRQSPDAVGDCVRSMDSYEARQRQLNAAVTGFKEFIGGQLLPVFSVFTGWMTKGVRAATSFAMAIFLDKEENNRLLRVFERIHALVKRLQPAMDRFAQTIRNGMGRARDNVRAVAEKLGGMENLFKILAVVAGAFLLVMNWGKIVAGAKLFLSVLSLIKGMFSLANLKILAVVAIVAVLALLVEDFIHFLMGNDSLIGTIFDKLGIGADNARQMIFDAFGQARDWLLSVWPMISSALTAIWDYLCTVGAALFRVFIAVVKAVFVMLQAFWASWGDQVTAWFTTLWDSFNMILLGFLATIEGIANFLSSVFTGDWQGAWEAILQIASGVWDMIVGILRAAWETIKLLFSMGLAAIHAFFDMGFGKLTSLAIEGIANIVRAIMDGLNRAADFIRGLPAQAVQWGRDFIDGLKNGILAGIDGVVNAVKGVGEKIRSFLHFSVPDEGPLTDYESWMPDFMNGLADGISKGEGTVLNRVRNLAGSIRTLMAAATADPTTAAAGMVSNTTSSVVQNVNISNSYHGGSAEAQKNVSKAMKKSATDATTQMARGLAYARG